MIRHLSKFDDSVDRWIVLWEHEFNEKFEEFKPKLGEDALDDMPDKINPRDAVKGGRTEVFKMHTKVKDPSTQMIRYLGINSLYPYVMSLTEFPIGHPIIRRGHGSCVNLTDKLRKDSVNFIGICLVCILAPKHLMVPYLPHKCDGKLMFLLCKACSLHGSVQRLPCTHDDVERSWIDTYTSIDLRGAMKVGYEVLEYMEVWHYPKGGTKLFKDFILNIARRKMECSGFLSWCLTDEDKHHYVDDLHNHSSITTTIEAIRSDPAGCYLNKIMANSVWGKWTQFLLHNKK